MLQGSRKRGKGFRFLQNHVKLWLVYGAYLGPLDREWLKKVFEVSFLLISVLIYEFVLNTRKPYLTGALEHGSDRYIIYH